MNKKLSTDLDINPEDIAISDISADLCALAELVGLASRLNASSSRSHLLNTFSHGLSEIWPGAGVRLCEFRQSSQSLVPIGAPHSNPIPLNGSLLGKIITGHSSELVADLSHELTFLRGREAPSGIAWKSMIGCPIPLEGTITHVVGIFLPESLPVSDRDRILLERAVMLIEPLLSRWVSQDSRMKAFLDITRAIASAVDAREPCLVGHGTRVSEFSQATATVHGLKKEFIERLGLAGLLHDIGRLGIPESILLKPGALDASEVRIMRTHPVLSQRYLSGVDFLYDVMPAIRHHHERFDGNGYPDELEGDEIPLGARIIGVADAFDAMTSPRPYRGAMSDHVAMNELRQNKGEQFDPIIVEAFHRAYDEKLILSQNVLKAMEPPPECGTDHKR